jgi:hypothetical protein
MRRYLSDASVLHIESEGKKIVIRCATVCAVHRGECVDTHPDTRAAGTLICDSYYFAVSEASMTGHHEERARTGGCGAGGRIFRPLLFVGQVIRYRSIGRGAGPPLKQEIVG